jgi:hypothetical protein
VIGLVLQYSTSWNDLSQYTYSLLSESNITKNDHQSVMLAKIQRIITFHNIEITCNNGVRTWINYFKLIPQLSRITINTDTYTTEYLAIIASEHRPLLTVNNCSLQPCLCYPLTSCGEDCKYAGAYHCDNCIVEPFRYCPVCHRNQHIQCAVTRKTKEIARLKALESCRECIIHDKEGPDDKGDIFVIDEDHCYCQPCMKLYQCETPTCTELICNRHMRKCSECKRNGCVFHVLTLPENYVPDNDDNDDETYEICNSCCIKKSTRHTLTT